MEGKNKSIFIQALYLTTTHILSTPNITHNGPPWTSRRFCHCSEKLSPLTVIYLYPVYTLKNQFSRGTKRPLEPWAGVLGRQEPGCYSRRFSYMLLDWAQILKGSGFFCPELSVWSGVGASAGGYSGSTCVLWPGEAVCRLRWQETLCWELFWLSFLSSGCWKQASERSKKRRLLLVLWVGVSISLFLFSTSMHTYINISTTFWLPSFSS